MFNSRTPTDPSIIDSVIFQDDSKPDFDDDLGAAMDLSGNPAAASTGNKGSPTIEFYALDMRSSPHDFHGIIDKYEIPPRKRGITRTVCRCIRRPAAKQPPPQGVTCTRSPRAALSDTTRYIPLARAGYVDLAPMHQRRIPRWRERVHPPT